MKVFDIQFDNVIDYVLALQDINDVALPFAAQSALNDVVFNAKRQSLNKVTNQMFNINKKTFFRANSDIKKNKAKDFGYNLNKISSEFGIVKSKNKFDKATEQVGNQQTAKKIDRSINPLGKVSKSGTLTKKPLSAADVDILKEKPLIYDSSINYRNVRGNRVWLSRAFQAMREKRGFIASNGKKGTLYKINSIKKRKPTKRNAHQFKISKTPLASYVKNGAVKLKTKHPFLKSSVDLSAKNMLESAFAKSANYQFKLAMKRRGIK